MQLYNYPAWYKSDQDLISRCQESISRNRSPVRPFCGGRGGARSSDGTRTGYFCGGRKIKRERERDPLNAWDVEVRLPIAHMLTRYRRVVCHANLLEQRVARDQCTNGNVTVCSEDTEVFSIDDGCESEPRRFRDRGNVQGIKYKLSNKTVESEWKVGGGKS